MYPHRIRLRGPWECQLLPAAGAPALPRRQALPCSWAELAAPGFVGRARCVRPFGFPGRIDEGEHVWITFAGVQGKADVALNGQPIAVAQRHDFDCDASALLGIRNRLEIVLDCDGNAGPIWNEVSLEIRRSAYMRAGAARVDQRVLAVSGTVMGPGGLALELYALVDGQHVHYQKIDADPVGRPFQFHLADVSPDAVSVRLDLVHVSTIWYALELPLRRHA